MTRRLSAIGVLLAFVVAACGGPAGTVFKIVTASPDGSNRMPVALGDETGLVTAIEGAKGSSGVGFEQVLVEADPADAKAVIVSWTSGACDDDTSIGFKRSGTDFTLRLRVNNGFETGCTANLVFHAIRIRFSEPVPADSIEAIQGL